MAGLLSRYQCLNCPRVYPSIQAHLIKRHDKNSFFALDLTRNIKEGIFNINRHPPFYCKQTILKLGKYSLTYLQSEKVFISSHLLKKPALLLPR